MKTKECHCELHRKEPIPKIPIPKIPKGFRTKKDIISSSFMNQEFNVENKYPNTTNVYDEIEFNTLCDEYYLEKSIYDKRILLIEEVMSLSPRALTLKYPDLWEDFKKHNKFELFHFVVIKKILKGYLD